MDEPVADEPAMGEPVADEPVADEPTADWPAIDARLEIRDHSHTLNVEGITGIELSADTRLDTLRLVIFWEDSQFAIDLKELSEAGRDTIWKFSEYGSELNASL